MPQHCHSTRGTRPAASSGGEVGEEDLRGGGGGQVGAVDIGDGIARVEDLGVEFGGDAGVPLDPAAAAVDLDVAVGAALTVLDEIGRAHV